ncbi:hypothetical protein BvCmsK50A_03122 [Escherichia coli]|nr:hypothetical protein BvCmsK50A_03122 [Escherichia coli]GCK13920.1 hypothetical protein BvCmsA113A_03561 [Escherichia coli]
MGIYLTFHTSFDLSDITGTILIHRFAVHTNPKITGIMQPVHLHKWAELT